MKKKIILIFVTLLLTGCTSEYNININENNINEKLTSEITDQEIKETRGTDNMDIVVDDDELTPFIKNDLYPFVTTTDIKYNKNVIYKKNKYYVTYDYTYNSLSDFNKSYVPNMCFENKKIEDDGSKYFIELSGKFNCLYSDEIKINLSTDMNVINSNAYKEKDKYVWKIDNSNVNDTYLYISLDKKNNKINTINNSNNNNSFNPLLIIVIIALFIISIFIFIIYRAVKE